MLPRRRLLGGSLHEGIGLNFATGQYYVREQGRPANVQPLTSLFTFTGGNQSMYMGPAGLLVASATNTPRIEYDANRNCLGLLMEAARTNLCLQSQDIATSWTLSGASASTNATTAPDGTSTADTLVESSGGTFHLVRQDIAITANTAYTFSLFVKAAGRTACKLQVSNTLENTGANVDVNLTAGTVGTVTNFGTGSSSAATITAFPNGWYRVSLRVIIDAASTTGRVQLLLANPVGTISYSGDGASGLHLWGMQYEAGQFASSYIPTTTVSVARTADSCVRTLASEFSATAGTVVVAGRASGGQDTVNAQAAWELNDSTAANRIVQLRVSSADTARYSMFTASVQQGPLDATFANLTAFKSSIAWATNDLAYSHNGAAALTDATATLPALTRLEIGCATGGGVQFNGHIRTFDYWPTRLPNTYLVSASS